MVQAGRPEQLPQQKRHNTLPHSPFLQDKILACWGKSSKTWHPQSTYTNPLWLREGWKTKCSSFGGGVGNCPEFKPVESSYNWEKGTKLFTRLDTEQGRVWLWWKKKQDHKGSLTSKTQGYMACLRVRPRQDTRNLPDPHHQAAAAKSFQSCPTLCNPVDGSPLGSPVSGILEARTLEWVAISFSNPW